MQGNVPMFGMRMVVWGLSGDERRFVAVALQGSMCATSLLHGKPAVQDEKETSTVLQLYYKCETGAPQPHCC